MPRITAALSILITLTTVFAVSAYAWDNTYPLIIDHLSCDLASVPANWIDSVKVNIKFHYAHTSHGNQLTMGLLLIENADDFYSMASEDMNLPEEPGALCIFNGQEDDTYITPDEYWETQPGMDKTRDVSDNNPVINTSTWAWCTQLNIYTEEETQSYLDSINTLEIEYPNSIFIYMTGNAQTTGSYGLNRHLRNEQIRQYCIDNNKVLFDFADLDCWWFNPETEEWEEATYEYAGDTIPVEHPQFEGEESGHTTYESCEQKGRAVWWMMAVIAGWPGGVSGTDPVPTAPGIFTLEQNHPNPFNPTTVIEYEIIRPGRLELAVFDISGRLVRLLFEGELPQGRYSETWDGRDRSGRAVASGMYLYRLKGWGATQKTRKMILIR